MPPKNNLGVSLSGGGYRASAFHIGTLRALHKMQVLEKVDVLSTISGGSITGAHYCLFKGDFDAFEKDMMDRINKKNIIKFILTSWSALQLAVFVLATLGLSIYFLFKGYAWLFLVCFAIFIILLLKFQFKIFPSGKELERAYDKYFFDGATLSQLCKKPTLAIGSSNLQTGRPFTFSWKKMGDSAYGSLKPPVYFKHEDFPVSRAVTASSCVPFAFTPVNIAGRFFENTTDMSRVKPKLVDGGVYDNQGIQKLTQKGNTYECKTVITSDAGGKLKFEKGYNNTLTLLIRTVDLFMNRIKAFQMVENIYQNVGTANRQIAYLSLGWDLDRCIPGFVDNMIKDQVLPLVMQHHGLEQPWIDDPFKFRPEIEQRLSHNTGYPAIKARDLSVEQLEFARRTKTSLRPLSIERIRLLAQHAENLTELQVKLYCPKI